MRKATYSAKPKDIKRESLIVNAEGQTLGRLATRVAHVLRGKHKPLFTPHIDCGDQVCVYNAEKIKVSGGKEKKKTYFTHSLYIAGDKLLTYEQVKARDPRKIIFLAVKGMLPHTRLGRQMMKKLKIVVGPEAPAGRELKF
jgi:large subunit ribosomal protein L13